MATAAAKPAATKGSRSDRLNRGVPARSGASAIRPIGRESIQVRSTPHRCGKRLGEAVVALRPGQCPERLRLRLFPSACRPRGPGPPSHGLTGCGRARSRRVGSLARRQCWSSVSPSCRHSPWWAAFTGRCSQAPPGAHFFGDLFEPFGKCHRPRSHGSPQRHLWKRQELFSGPARKFRKKVCDRCEAAAPTNESSPPEAANTSKETPMTTNSILAKLVCDDRYRGGTGDAVPRRGDRAGGMAASPQPAPGCRCVDPNVAEQPGEVAPSGWCTYNASVVGNPIGKPPCRRSMFRFIFPITGLGRGRCLACGSPAIRRARPGMFQWSAPTLPRSFPSLFGETSAVRYWRAMFAGIGPVPGLRFTKVSRPRKFAS